MMPIPNETKSLRFIKSEKYFTKKMNGKEIRMGKLMDCENCFKVNSLICVLK